ncbi:GNAT family N-acetyltransferase [soil metagenome]
MRCVVHPDFDSGAGAVLPWLDADPVVNSLQAGVLRGVLAGLYTVDETAVLAHVEDDGTVLGVAVRTPGRRLILSPMPAGAAAAMAEVLLGAGRELPGAIGDVASTNAFAGEWQRRTGGQVRLAMAQRVHRLDRVIAPTGVPGRMRDADAGDLDLITAWAEAMGDEIGHDAPDRNPHLREQLSRRITEDRMPLWRVDDTPVSMAGPSLPTAGVVRIALVYTPPKHRRLGYAAACVATVSQQALDHGAAACSLITDLANPTSNSVYRRIGYYPVAETQELTFVPVGDRSGESRRQ